MQTADIIAIAALVVSLASSVVAWRASTEARKVGKAEKRTYVVARLSEARSLINKILYEMDFLINFTEPKSKEAAELFKVSAQGVREAGEAVESTYRHLMAKKEHSVLELEEMLCEIERSISLANERLDKIASLKRLHDLKF